MSVHRKAEKRQTETLTFGEKTRSSVGQTTLSSNIVNTSKDESRVSAKTQRVRSPIELHSKNRAKSTLSFSSVSKKKAVAPVLHKSPPNEQLQKPRILKEKSPPATTTRLGLPMRSPQSLSNARIISRTSENRKKALN